jgi:hypothetical protein
MAGRRSLEGRLAQLERTLVPSLYASLADLVLASMGRPTRPGVRWEGPLVELVLAAVRSPDLESRA